MGLRIFQGAEVGSDNVLQEDAIIFQSISERPIGTIWGQREEHLYNEHYLYEGNDRAEWFIQWFNEYHKYKILTNEDEDIVTLMDDYQHDYRFFGPPDPSSDDPGEYTVGRRLCAEQLVFMIRDDDISEKQRQHYKEILTEIR